MTQRKAKRAGVVGAKPGRTLPGVRESCRGRRNQGNPRQAACGDPIPAVSRKRSVERKPAPAAGTECRHHRSDGSNRRWRVYNVTGSRKRDGPR